MWMENKELWKDIPGYEGIYQVSSYGNVKSVNRKITNSIGTTRIYKEKLLKINKDRYGYPICKLWKNSKGKNHTIHRLVAICFIKNVDDKPLVNHVDGNKCNNHISNLEWCTSSENDLHAFSLGLRSVHKGEKCNFAKLNSDEVKEIKKLKKEGITQREIAKLFNVSEGNVSQIINGQRWAWLE
ncbi:helix-turn-helix domain-containing protein [Staphylococcus arlettae]|nr:helix-turn-helix domain-containing protein [Staphylococcus arlettae]